MRATIPAADNPTPVTPLMVQPGFDSHQRDLPYAGDYFAIAPHGMANTHIDALCHQACDLAFFGGVKVDDVERADGYRELGAETIRPISQERPGPPSRARGGPVGRGWRTKGHSAASPAA